MGRIFVGCRLTTGSSFAVLDAQSSPESGSPEKPCRQAPETPNSNQSEDSEQNQHRATDLKSVVNFHLHELLLFAVVEIVIDVILDRLSILSHTNILVRLIAVEDPVQPAWQTSRVFLRMEMGTHDCVTHVHDSQRNEK